MFLVLQRCCSFASILAGRGVEEEGRGSAAVSLYRLSRPTVAARERDGSWCFLLRRRGATLSCGCLQRCLPCSSGHGGGGLLVSMEAPPSSPRELLGRFSPAATAAGSVIPYGLKGVGHHSRCFSRRAHFAAADGAVAMDGDLVGIWRLSSWTGSRFYTRSRILSVLLLGLFVFLLLWGALCKSVTHRCGNEAASGSFKTPSPFRKKKRTFCWC
jgi:hypothetical protein